MTATDSQTAWRLNWLTPIPCRLLLVLLLAAGFCSHLYYLHHCPIDLSGDEAQYWDWSRHLDLNYYSKGPLVAYIIRASCAIFGETMPAVRYPALLFSVGTAIVCYALTKKLFGSEKLALGAVLLLHVIPMFIAGSVIMTIDPPMFFCWALACYFSSIAIFDNRKVFWVFVGLAVGVGFLAKYAEFLFFVGLFGFLIFHKDARKQLRAALIAPLIAALFTIPVIYWNQQHNWLSFRHIAHQTGASEGELSALNLFDFIGGQIGAVGPTFAVIMIGGVIYAIRSKRDQNADHGKLMLLCWIGLAFFGANALSSLRAKVQVNWPAPAYFTLIILTAYFLSIQLRSQRTWKPWRGWFYATICIGAILIPIAHDTACLMPLVKMLPKKQQAIAGQNDPLARVRGWRQLGNNVSTQLKTLGADAFVLCDDYQQTAETAFYVAGQPNTYCAGAYFGKRLSQYDVWPDRRLIDNPALLGKDAVYVGKGGTLPDEIIDAFDRVEKQPLLEIKVDRFTVRSFKTWRCYHFKGMPHAIGGGGY